MGLWSRLIDRVRTITGVRKARRVPAVSQKPPAGTSIVLDNLRMRLKYAIDDDLWQWLVSKGWRTMQLRNNRRRYVVVAEKTLMKLMKADLEGRNALHDRLTRPGRSDGGTAEAPK